MILNIAIFELDFIFFNNTFSISLYFLYTPFTDKKDFID